MTHPPAHLVLVAALGLAAPGAAQDRPAPLVEALAGWAGFVDEAWIGRTMVGAAGRFYLSQRIAVGSELAFLDGDDGAHDWTLTGTATLDLKREDARLQAAVTPYLALGVGYLQQTTRIGTEPFTSSDATASAGAGLRIRLGSRFFVAPEVRVGIEPEVRIGLAVGWRPQSPAPPTRISAAISSWKRAEPISP